MRYGLIPNKQHIRVSAGTFQASTAETNRILFIGDSFLRPDGPLSRYLMARLSTQGVTSFNAAISGNGPYQYLTELEIYLESFKPDIVLMGYYVGNDLSNVMTHQKKRADGFLSRFKNRLRTTVRKLYLHHSINQFRIALLVPSPKKAAKAQHLISSKTSRKQDLPEALNPFLRYGASTAPNYLLDNLMIESDESKNAWAKSSELIKVMHKLSTKSGAKFSIVIFPSDAQLNEQRLKFYSSLGYTSVPSIVGSTTAQEKLMLLCKTLEIQCLDLYKPVAQATKQGQKLYLDKDLHFSKKGDIFAAKKILKFLREKLLSVS